MKIMRDMSNVDKIKDDINGLSNEESARLEEWLSEKNRKAAEPRYPSSWKSVNKIGFLYIFFERLFFYLKFVSLSPREYCYSISRKYTGQSDIKFGPVSKDSLTILFFLSVGLFIPSCLVFKVCFFYNWVLVMIGIYAIAIVCQHEVNLLLFERFRVNKLQPPNLKCPSISSNDISNWYDLLYKIKGEENNPLKKELKRTDCLEQFNTISSKYQLTLKMKEDIVKSFNAIKDNLTFHHKDEDAKNAVNRSSDAKKELDDLYERLGESGELKKKNGDLSDSQKEGIKWFNITILKNLFPNILSIKRPWRRSYFCFKRFFRSREYIKEYKLNSRRRRFILSVMSLWLLFVSYSLIYYALAHCSFDPCLYHHYWDALYFSIVTGTTLGFGDIKPICWQAKLFSASQSLITLLFALTIIAKTLSLLPQHKSMQ